MAKVQIDKAKCVGCGVCQNVCPAGFQVVDGKAEVKDEDAACVEQAASSCPTKAIKINQAVGQGGQTEEIAEINEDFQRPNDFQGSAVGPGFDRGFGRGRGGGFGFGRGAGRGRGHGAGRRQGRGIGRGRGGGFGFGRGRK
jgi:ferredoxin